MKRLEAPSSMKRLEAPSLAVGRATVRRALGASDAQEDDEHVGHGEQRDHDRRRGVDDAHTGYEGVGKNEQASAAE